MAEDKFKLPRSSYEKICKIIKSYGRLTQPGSLDEVAKLCAMNITAISANNSFLVNIGFIEGGKKNGLRPIKGRELAQVLEHELPDQIQENWARIVRDNEFLGKMTAAVKIRGKMDSSTLEFHIAYSAGEAKSGQVMTGARAVVDILRAAGVVREHEGQLFSTEKVSPTIEARLQVPLEPVVAAATGHSTARSAALPIAESSGVGAIAATSDDEGCLLSRSSGKAHHGRMESAAKERRIESHAILHARQERSASCDSEKMEA